MTQFYLLGTTFTLIGVVGDGNGGFEDVFGNPFNYPVDVGSGFVSCVALKQQATIYFTSDCFDNSGFVGILCKKVYP